MLKKIVKNTALLFVVGALLAMAAPTFATWAISLGVAPALANSLAVTHPIWGGIFFGAFGAINTALTPIFDALFNDTPTTRTTDKQNAKSAPTIVLSHGPIAHAPTVAADVADDQAPGTTFQDRVGGRVVEGNFQDRVAQNRKGVNFQEKLEASRAEPAQVSV